MMSIHDYILLVHLSKIHAQEFDNHYVFGCFLYSDRIYLHNVIHPIAYQLCSRYVSRSFTFI